MNIQVLYVFQHGQGRRLRLTQATLPCGAQGWIAQDLFSIDPATGEALVMAQAIVLATAINDGLAALKPVQLKGELR